MTTADFVYTAWPTLAGAVGGIASIVITAFTKFGDRLTDFVVSRQLASFKHRLESQIEQLKAELSHVTDRHMRSNEREYTAIISAWEQFVDAYLATHQCVGSFISHPDFSRMSDTEVSDYLRTTDFSEQQQKQIFHATDRNHTFGKITQLRQIVKAGQAIFDARSVLRKQGIFIPKKLEDDFGGALEMFSRAQIQRHMEFDYGHSRDALDTFGKFLKDGPILFEEIKGKVRGRILLSDEPGAGPVSGA